MEFKSKNPNYSYKFLNHFNKFITEYNLFGPKETLLIGVSGGIDSMAVLFAIHQLKTFGYSNKVRVINLNHQTRDGQIEEAIMVKEFCKHLEVECITRNIENLNPHKNFEYRARQKRYEIFYEEAQKGEKIVLAHHIDDSFEWTMLQSLRSSSIEGLIGIPLINDSVIRPFMCVTKKQVTRFVQSYDLPFLEDPTNESLKYERNFIRNEVISSFKDRYSGYLKQYVYRHNEIARRLGVHLIDKNRTSFKISYSKKSVLIYSFDMNNDYSGIENLVFKGIKHLNIARRGSLKSQLSKMKQALKNNKKGPMNLVGNLKAYLDYNMVFLTEENSCKLKLEYKDFKTFSFREFGNYIEDELNQPKNHPQFPFVVLIKNTYLDKRNFSISFNTKNINQLCEDQTYYPALKLLHHWSKKSNRHKVLRLNFLKPL